MMKQAEDDSLYITESPDKCAVKMEVVADVYQHQQQTEQKSQLNTQTRPYSNAERQRRYREKRKADKTNSCTTLSQSSDVQPQQEQSQHYCQINKRQSQSNAERQRKYRKLLREKQKQQQMEDINAITVLGKTPHTSSIHRKQNVDQAEQARKRHLNKQRQSRFRAKQRFESPCLSSHQALTKSETLQLNNQKIFNKEQNIYIAKNNKSTVQNSESDHHPKLLEHHVVQRDNFFKNVTDTNIKEEVCYHEINEDILVNTNEQLHIKSENPLSPITNEQMKYHINNEHIEIKQEVPWENTDFDVNRSMPKENYPHIQHMLQHSNISEENLTNINIKQEVCYEEVNEDIQLNGNGRLQIKSEYTQFPETDVQTEYQTNNIQDEMIIQNKMNAEKYTIDFASKNTKSKLLVPEIKVFNHILEISPLKCTNFDDQRNISEQDVPKRVKFKKNIRIKTPAERSREYRARKKARQMAAKEESINPTPIQTEIQEESSQSDNSQESDGCVQITKKRKTPADYSREYRARKRALKELQKEHQKSENNNLNSQIKAKTAAERSREYRARKKAYTDLEEPIPIEPSIELIVSNDPCPLSTYQNSILPDVDYNTIIPNAETTNINNTREESSDSKIGLHDVLHHIHNYISNKFSEEISTGTDIQKETRNAEVIEDIKANVKEQLQVKTEYTRDSISGKEESKFLAPESTINNVYDHILEIKQEAPCEYTNFEDYLSIDSNIQNNDTDLQEGFRIKCEENQNFDSQLIGPSAEMSLPPFAT